MKESSRLEADVSAWRGVRRRRRPPRTRHSALGWHASAGAML